MVNSQMNNEADISTAQLSDFLTISPLRRQLEEIVFKSRQHLGFFSRTPSRALEYPWVVEQLRVPPGQRIVDLGAGVSVLPLVLSEMGHSITTIDYSAKIVNDFPREKWNEWGFLDNSAISNDINLTAS
jgi:2-polyprenyl-3-methyl-5-hydroxy-6-metoxy-1,4-benzoquinol methylase